METSVPGAKWAVSSFNWFPLEETSTEVAVSSSVRRVLMSELLVNPARGGARSRRSRR